VLALVVAHRQVEGVGGREQFCFDGEHFTISVFDVGLMPLAEHIDLVGHSVSITPSTLQSLRGRTLMVRQVVDSSGESRHVLVAA
jgi:hypothetical protein